MGSRGLVFGFLLSFLTFAGGCRRVVSDPTGNPPLGDGGALKRSDVLTAFGACAYDLARDFRDRAEIHERRTATYAASPTAENLAVARASWEDAIDLWERAELFQFGPAAPFSAPGGKDLRSQIYSWPAVSRCPIEQSIVGRSYELPDFVDSAPSMRGLYASEYLLFYGGADNVCGPSSAINTNGTWAALGASGLASRKASYAHAAAVDLVARARSLESAWSPAGGNFIGQLATAGTGSSIYPTQQLAFNAISDALFYVEIGTKDAKIGKPSGLNGCSTDTCPEALESPWAHRSKRHVRSNLVGGKMLIFGCDEAGTQLAFDDLLRAMGQGAVADRLAVAFDGAIGIVDAIPDADLDETLARDPQALRTLYLAMKKITDILRTDFVTVLDLEIPKVIEGDND